MSEEGTVARAGAPGTRSTIARDLRALGLENGMTVIVHSSLAALGWVAGGAHAVVLALQDVLTPDGTLVMPTHTGHLSEPRYWRNPPVPEEWWPVVRSESPAFDPTMTPPRMMGALVDCFWRAPGVVRSAHPQTSFGAWGARARGVTAGHELTSAVGERSPLARVYDLDGWVLLLGVTHSNNTSLHLAEHRATWPGKRDGEQGAPMIVDGERRWVTWQETEWDESDFERIGADFEAQTGRARLGAVGRADCIFVPQRALVDYGVGWISEHRESG